MKKAKLRLVAMLLCVLMCLTLLPAEALAYTAESAENVTASVVSNGKVKITKQPKNQSVKQGAKVTFQVKASGKHLKYQWYYRKSSSGSWKKVSGGTKATLKVTANRMNGWQYRCQVKSGSKKVYSRAATLKVNYVKYRALLIGEVNFSPKCTRNKGDVLKMKSMLSSVKTPKGGSYKITCKYDLSESGIQSAIKSAFKGADSNDVSLFFIATHGVTNVESGSWAGAICTSDGGYVQMGELAGWLKKVPGKVIVIIGSCGSGAAVSANGAKGASKFDEDAFNTSVIQAFAAADEILPSEGGDAANIGDFRNSKFYVLTAAKHMESSWGCEDGSASSSYNYFPYYIVKGAKGAADSNKDKKITLKELYKYADKEARGPYYYYDENDVRQGPFYQHARVYPSNSSYVLFKTG